MKGVRGNEKWQKFVPRSGGRGTEEGRGVDVIVVEERLTKDWWSYGLKTCLTCFPKDNAQLTPSDKDS
ncbi:hypothetical protein Pmani_023015 [Petrolisthes manimaculis]|uniref:Uncharacterized protein n=1 Tax=Petrolisthes manimaculis TaxID=1843537 RepID=A0AAE1PAI4_9EUCA|nr:hypothetical protein Pmani_023015 [Petrolisthes manimaculis]